MVDFRGAGIIGGIVESSQALAGVQAQTRIYGDECGNESLSLGAELPKPVFHRLQCSYGQKVNPNLEGETDVVKVTTDFSVEPSDGLQFRRIQKVLGNAEEIFVGVYLDQRRRHLASIADGREAYLNKNGLSGEIYGGIGNGDRTRCIVSAAIGWTERCPKLRRRLV
jgi:hypothetical protein